MSITGASYTGKAMIFNKYKGKSIKFEIMGYSWSRENFIH